MKKFIYRTIIFFILIFSLSFVFLTIADNGLKNERLGSVATGNINCDVLIIGTSRTYRHFDTQLLEKATGKNFFNLGLDASGFKTQKELLRYYIKYNGYPKEVIWEYNFGFLNKEMAIYDYELLLPIADEENIFELLGEYGLVSELIHPNKVFRYIGHPKLVWRGLKNQISPQTYLDFKIQNLKWDKHDFESKYLNGNYSYQKEISEASLTSYLEIIDDFKKNNVNLSMVFTPMYSGVFLKNDGKKELLNYYDSLFTKNSINNINLLFSTISDDTLNFYNVLHMNRNGVNKFSKELLKAF